MQGITQVFARKLDSTAPVQLTRGAADSRFPFWSPDQSRIYYVSEDPSGRGVWSVGVAPLEVQHRLTAPDATIFYHLNQDLTLNEVTVGTSFERVHLALHASGIIDHDLSQAEIAQFRKLTYLKR
ncbi:MAG: hypothetical protein ABSH49_30690 [Bryobacteraceae bacterium]